MCEQRAITRMSLSRQSKTWLRGVACLAWMTAALVASSGSAQTPADFFRGNPNVVPVHTPGSGGLLGANRLYNTAAKDGTVLGMINRGIVFEPLLGGQGAQFDALKLNYIGSRGRDTTVCAARK